MGLFAPMKQAVDEREAQPDRGVLPARVCGDSFAHNYPKQAAGLHGREELIAVEIQMKNLNQALGDFRKDNGFYPTGSNGLQFLVRQPAGTTNWQGPYL